MSVHLLPGRIHCLRPSPPRRLPRCAPHASSSSDAPTQASPTTTTSPVFAVEYLVQSCGLSSDEALKASKYIQHLKSPDNPNAVLCFLREIGLSDSDIRAAVSRDARILCTSLENHWRPNIAKLQELGLSPKDISAIIARRSYLFRHSFPAKVDFWMQALGSTEFLSELLQRDSALLCSSLENVLIPNISFLKDDCGLSPRQINRLIKSSPRLISSRPDVLKKQADRAEALGVARKSRAFLYALIIVSYLDQSTIDARLNNIMSFGLSHEEVTSIVSRLPLVLSQTEEMMTRKIEFLLNEFGCDKSYLVQNPSLLTYSLDTRMIPRTLVRKHLKSKGISVADQTLATFMKATERQFLVKFVLPYEHAIPELHQIYADACGTKL